MRTREIGIRMALGAHSSDVRALIIRYGMLLTVGGLVVGLAASLLTTPILQSQLIKLPANDPATFTGVSVLLIAIALVASLRARATRDANRSHRHASRRVDRWRPSDRLEGGRPVEAAD